MHFDKKLNNAEKIFLLYMPWPLNMGTFLTRSGGRWPLISGTKNLLRPPPCEDEFFDMLYVAIGA